jgi:hypothetical protein
VVAIKATARAMPTMVAEVRCNFCGLKGHKEAGCFKKYPKKAPAWFKEKTTKGESATSSVEVSLALLELEKLGIDILKLQEEGIDTLAILCQKNVWICNMGAIVRM